MTKVQHEIIKNGDGGATVVAFPNGILRVADKSHPNFEAICRALAGEPNDDDIEALFDINKSIEQRTKELSVRVKVVGDTVYFDDKPDEGALADQIIAFLDQGVANWQPLVTFRENLAMNPNPESVEQLYAWLKAEGFTITEDGYILGYKYVDSQGCSTHSAPANKPVFVDGVPHTGRVPYPVGSTVWMPREDVTFDPGEACSSGLHVGTWGYSGGGSNVRLVKVHPMHVVSVPHDSSGQKMRVECFKVIGDAEEKIDSAVYVEPVVEDDDDDDSWGYRYDYRYDD